MRYVRHRLAVCVMTALLSAACSSQPGDPGTHRGPVSLETSEVVLLAPDRVNISVSSCNGEPEVTELVERGNDIRIEVVTTVSNPGNDCLDSIEVTLPTPLGQHDLVDLTSGQQLIVDDGASK